MARVSRRWRKVQPGRSRGGTIGRRRRRLEHADSCRRTLAGNNASSSVLSVLVSGNPDLASKRAVRFWARSTASLSHRWRSTWRWLQAIAKRRVRAMQENGKECEEVLNSYEEIRRSKGIFDEILEGMTRGTSSSGVGYGT